MLFHLSWIFYIFKIFLPPLRVTRSLLKKINRLFLIYFMLGFYFDSSRFGKLSLLPFVDAQDWFRFDVMKEHLGKAGPAKIVKPPITQTIINGEPAIFYCQIDGNPLISTSLLYNGIPRSTTLSIPKGALLRIPKVQMIHNGDRIDCVVRNPMGEETKKANIIVIDNVDDVPPGFPRIRQQKDHYNGDVGQAIKLVCEIEGDPLPTITWFKNNIPMDLGDPRFILSDSGSLTFKRLLRVDDGIYECRGINSVGSTLSLKMQLQIRNNPITPQWIFKPKNVKVRPGHGVNLTCSAKGNPTPHLRWLTQYRQPINELNEKESILLLTDITEPATYICLANNSMGTIQHYVKVEVKKIPKSPVNVRAVKIGTNFAVVAWNQNPKSPSRADSYTMVITDTASELGVLGRNQITDIRPQWPLPNLIKGPNNLPQDNYTVVKNITDLKPYTRYAVEVFAVSNTLGKSDPSPVMHFHTKESPPNSPPQSVHANADTPTSIIVKWAAPVEANGKITGYNVYYTRERSKPINKWEVSHTTRNFVQIGGLFANYTYYIKVNAENKAGPGPLSQEFPIIVKPGVPPQPQNFRGAGITSTSINVIWTPPQIPSTLKLLEYQLTFKILSGPSPLTSSHEQRLSIPPDKTDYKLGDLWPNTLYHISLSAITKHGIGVPADLHVRTENRVPSMPQGLRIKVLSPNSIEIRWRRGIDNHESISSFKIKVMKMGGTGDGSSSKPQKPPTLTSTVHSVPAKTDNSSWEYSFKVEDLESGMFYKVLLWSVGQSGLSVPYMFDDIKTSPKDMIPSPPLNLRLNQLRHKQENGKTVLLADMAWDLPENTHGTIVAYKVSHTLIGPSKLLENLRNRSIPIKEYVTNVTTTNYCSSFRDGLGFGKQYRFTVAAINSNNDQGLTAKLNISTIEAAPSSYPRLVHFVGISSKSVNISWEPPYPEHQNGIIKNYRVLYYLYGMKNSSSKFVNTLNQYVRINGLQENKLYTFQVRAFTKPGPGPWSPEVNFRTAVILPDPPVNIIATRINERQIKVTWELPSNLNVKINGFKLYFCYKNLMKTDPESCDKLLVGPITIVTYGGLKFNSDYEVAIRSQGIDNRFGPLSKTEVAKMSETIRYTELSVRELRCNPGQHSIEISWKRPDTDIELSKFLIRINGYRTYIEENGDRKKVSRSFKVREVDYSQSYEKFVIDLKDMSPNTVYDISVQTRYLKKGSIIHSGGVQNTSCRTFMERPRTVSPPDILSINRTGMIVTFRIYRVTEKLGVISNYYLIVEPTNQNSNSSSTKYSLESLKSTSPSSNAPTLVAEFPPELFGKRSNITLDVGNSVWTELSTREFSAPHNVLLSTVKFDKTKRYSAFLRACIYKEQQRYRLNSKLKRTLQPFCRNSKWSNYFSFDEAFTRPDTTRRNMGDNSLTRQASTFTIWIIIVIVSLALIAIICITVGCFIKRRKIKRYYNSPQELIMNGDPSLKQALISQNNSAPPAYAPISHSNGVLEVDATLQKNFKTITANGGGGVSCSTAMGAAVSVTNATNRNGTIAGSALIGTGGGTGGGGYISSSSRYPPIPSSHLSDYIMNLKMNDNAKFTEEYESIDPGHQFTWNHSNMEVNKPKNRYANVIAYDHSRVVLANVSGVMGSDYINANYCDGYRKQNGYIATQGPLPETFEAFWRMVWENRCAVIVMMTRLEERQRVKCDQYWPSRGSEKYDNSGLTVTHQDTVELAYYTVRKFSLIKKLGQEGSNSETRDVLQCQFTAWPDHGVPQSPLPLLMFIRRVRACTPADSGPTVVHCSAGVGRTGAYVLLDTQLSMLQHEHSIDVRGNVARLRTHRNYMVQTEDQYQFVYEALLEASLSGNTDISIRHLHAHVTKLKQPLPVLGVSSPNQFSTGIELEFNHLSEVSNRPKLFTTASLPENRLKNRLINILPFEHCRVCLQPLRNQDGSDYVNASFVDGYRCQRAYIATQGPLANTVADFWRMLWQHNSSIIVMLTHLREIGREKCSQYWPTDRAATFGQIIVEPMVEYNMPSFILREFRVRHIDTENSTNEEHKTIRQFQFLDWPEQGVPRSGESLIDFIGQVHKTKDQFGQEGPITVHCSAGVGRTGVFLALSIILDRMRSEGFVDLFQTVRLLRIQRPCMVQTEDQYQFCYLTALEYLSSFDQFLS